jgi:CHAD domain-containing protein
MRTGSQLSDDAAQLHAMRIACKKLRYSAEIFRPLFGAGKSRRYLTSLARLQDIMGVLNDIAIAHRLLDEVGDKVKMHATRALIMGWMEHGQARRKAELKRQWKRFSEQGAFWN